MEPYFIVYTREGCGYCEKAVELLNEKQEPYVTTDLTKNTELLQQVQTIFSHETTPIVVRVDQNNSNLNLVGGFSELDIYFNTASEEEEEEVEEAAPENSEDDETQEQE